MSWRLAAASAAVVVGLVISVYALSTHPQARWWTRADPPSTRQAPAPGTGDLGERRGGPSGGPSHANPGESRTCEVGYKLVPSCGVLWGVAPGAHTPLVGAAALRQFERKTGRTQAVFHAYHRGQRGMFPTAQEVALAREPGRPRILFLNWKPTGASWAAIARGHRATDAYLDRLARHILATYPEQFFFTVHHEPEDDVRERAGSGYTARDYAAMFRHVVLRLRAHGVGNLVTVLVHMAYVPLTSRPWFARMYPGDDVVDWIGFDTYAYSEPGYGHGDFAELMNRRSSLRPHWPGFYNWATVRHPTKPLMVAEWGVWSSNRNPAHKARFYRSVATQIGLFPRVKALVHFDTPRNQRGWDSRVDSTPDGLAAYRLLGSLPVFRVLVR
jgi:Glycosyl hydrolase family 26